MVIIYNIIIRAYHLLIRLFSLWNEKARQWLQGRKNWEESLKSSISSSDPVIWFHCSSLGEFEQGRTIIEEVYRRSGNRKVLLTFFSPSGYEKRKDYQYADYVAYLPLDTRRNARKFFKILSIEFAVFIKYEFWYHFLHHLKKNNIPVYLTSGRFRSDQLFFKWYGKWYRNILSFFTTLFVQDNLSKRNLEKIGVTNVIVAGDSRFDRVLDIASANNNIALYKSNGSKVPVLVAGSTWPQDEKIIHNIYQQNRGKLGIIIAPHEPSEKHIEHLQQLFPEAFLFTELNGSPVSDGKIIIVNTIGHLSSLYRYGDFAYIGGGFSKGIHNILEATAASLPVIFGPKYSKFGEAEDLVHAGGAFSVSRADEALKIVNAFLNDQSDLEKCAHVARHYTLSKKGATRIITEYLMDSLSHH